MSPAYKRQHYLPAAYLKYFSIDQTQCGRDSWVWRFDGKTKCRVRVESQCAGNYHYSKEDAANVEKMFQQAEGKYCSIVDKIKSGLPLTERDGALLFNMFDFYIRNNIHKNEMGKEGIAAYQHRMDIFWRQILLKTAGEYTKRDILNHIAKYWGVEIFTAPGNRVFITSDNPSVWTSVNAQRPGLHLLTLPITPRQVAVAYDRRFVWIISREMTEEDYLTLMSSQIHNAVRCVFSSIDISDENLKALKDRFTEKEFLDCRISESSWTLVLASLPLQYCFSFSELPPPLM